MLALPVSTAAHPGLGTEKCCNSAGRASGTGLLGVVAGVFPSWAWACGPGASFRVDLHVSDLPLDLASPGSLGL